MRYEIPVVLPCNTAQKAIQGVHTKNVTPCIEQPNASSSGAYETDE